jgi:hypothetical protein
MPSMGNVHKFLTAVWSDWLARMSGPLTVPFTIAAFMLPSTMARISFAILAVSAALVTCYRIWGTEHERAQKMSAQLQEIENGKPKLKLRAVYSEPVYQHFSDASGKTLHEQLVPFLKVRFVNDPDKPYPSANATGVRAYIDYYSLPDEVHVLSLDGRWAESDQPPAYSPFLSRAHLLAATFGIGEAKSVDIAYCDSNGTYCAWNSDNYDYVNQFWQHPGRILKGERFRVGVRLRGDWIDKHVSLVFSAQNKGFVIESYEEDGIHRGPQGANKL